MPKIFIRLEVTGDDRLSDGTVANDILLAILQRGRVDSKEYRKSGLMQLLEVSLETPPLQGSSESPPLEKNSGRPDPAASTIRTQS